MRELFQGFTEEEYQLYVKLNERFMENTKTALARRKKYIDAGQQLPD